MKFYKAIIACFWLITSCNFDKPNWPISKDFDTKDENTVVIIDNHSCELPSNDNIINDSLLVGVWKDSATWLHEEDCIFSVDYINKSLSLELRESSRCILSTVSPSKSKNGDGSYWTKVSNDSNFLFFGFNKHNDTLFQQGDTMFISKYYVNYFDSSSLYLTIFELSKKEFNKKTVQLKRVK